MSVPPSPPMRLTSRLLIPLAALLFAGGVWALSTDKRQDIEIEADAAELDDLKGIVVYRGNVIVKQGSLRMTGDTMTVTFNEQDDMDTVIMRGNPATYRQLPDGGEIYDQAEALQMEYYARKDYVILIDEALVSQEGLRFSGNRIEYDTVTNKVQVKGGTETGKSGDAKKSSNKDGRVKIIIEQKKRK